MASELPGADERHPAPDTPRDLLRTASLGFAAGLRSMMPLAVLSAQLEREGPDIADGGWAVDALATPWAVLGLALAALGEVVADKLPVVPSRLLPLPLAGRVLLGGTTCALASLAGGRRSDTGALIGSLSAVAGSLAGYSLRTLLGRALPVPSLVVALAEDGLALTLAGWAVQR